MPDEPVNKRDNKGDEGGGQTTTGVLADAPHEYAVDLILRHVVKIHNILSILHLYDYTSPDNTVEPPEHIFQHFITHYWRRLNKKDEV